MKRVETKKPTRLESFRAIRADFTDFMYSKNEDGTAVVMGRTGASWGKISLFFFVYYACLAGFFAAMFAIAFSTMPDIKDGPKHTMFIEDKPALLVFPVGGLGSYAKGHRDGLIKGHKNFLKAYVEQYEPCYDGKPCKPGDSYRPSEKTKQCYFDIDQLGDCSPGNSTHNATFGFDSNKPCLYLRLSKIYGWKPEPKSGGKFVTINCTADNKKAKIKYWPKQDKFFPISFWPFRGESHFMTPIGAIQVESERATTVKCKVIAHNIELSDTYKLKRGATGKVEFTVSGAPK